MTQYKVGDRFFGLNNFTKLEIVEDCGRYFRVQVNYMNGQTKVIRHSNVGLNKLVSFKQIVKVG